MQKLAAALLLLSSCAAHAGVIYRWQDLTPSAALGTVTGIIEISNGYWSPGGTFTWNGANNARPPGLDQLAAGGDRFMTATWPSINDPFSMADVTVVLGALLTGSISVTDAQANIRMSSVGSVWTITDYGTDLPSCSSHQCGGGTGQWVLDLSTLPLPEPGTYALVLAALAATAAARRR